jgi:hypothetical protein
MLDRTKSPSYVRQVWLEDAVVMLRPHFQRKDYTVPNKVRVSVGFPKGQHGPGQAIGQCWDVIVSSDGHAEIFVSPALGGGNKVRSITVLATLAHELVHATVGNKAGHKAPFKKCALAIGLEGKMTATVAGKEFLEVAGKIIDKLGMFPAGAINVGVRKKQTTRLLKCECDSCGYAVRVTRKWVESAGTPVCPTDKVSMSCDVIDGEEEDFD